MIASIEICSLNSPDMQLCCYPLVPPMVILQFLYALAEGNKFIMNSSVAIQSHLCLLQKHNLTLILLSVCCISSMFSTYIYWTFKTLVLEYKLLPHDTISHFSHQTLYVSLMYETSMSTEHQSRCNVESHLVWFDLITVTVQCCRVSSKQSGIID